jgi:hypothetical protein
VVVADHGDRQRREVGGAQQLHAGLGVGAHHPHLLVRQPRGLVEHVGRDGELADVVHEQADAELAQAVAEAVVAAPAAVVGPALARPGAAGDQQPEHGDLDAVAVRVGVEGAEVVERERRLGNLQQVGDERVGDLRERGDDAVGQPRALAQRGAGGIERVAGGAVHALARLWRERLDDVDAP